MACINLPPLCRLSIILLTNVLHVARGVALCSLGVALYCVNAFVIALHASLAGARPSLAAPLVEQSDSIAASAGAACLGAVHLLGVLVLEYHV